MLLLDILYCGISCGLSVCNAGVPFMGCWAQERKIEGKRGPGQPKMTWKTLTERDRREWNLNKVVIGMCGDPV